MKTIKSYALPAIFFFTFLQLNSQELIHEYYGQNAPGCKAKELLINDFFKEEDNRKRSFNFAFSPDGKELFFSFVKERTPEGTFYEIKTSKFIENKWTKPVTASFSGKYWDVDINYSPDGKYLFFASERPVNGTIHQGIFYLEKTDEGWSNPIFTGTEVSSEYGEVWPSISNKKNLFFRSDRPGGYGKDDLYRAQWIDGKFRNVQNLGSNVNTQYGESNATISPDESYIVFCSTRPEDGNSPKIYVSFQIGNNVWTKGIPLGKEINETISGGPTFSADGKYLIFGTLTGTYWISTRYIEQHR